MRTFRLRTFVLLLLCCTATAFAQHKKTDKSFKTDKNVKINLDARHTNVIFETWDRNEVQIEAYVDGKLSAPEAKTILESWKLEASGSASEVNISSGGGMMKLMEPDMSSLHESMGHLQEMLAPLMNDMVAPMLKDLAKNPPLPPEMAAKMGNLNFDFEAYQKEGEKYMQKWEKQIEEKFGKDFEIAMEKWAAQFEKNAEIWEKNMEKKMEIKGEKFEKSMESWAENFGAAMEKWGEEFAAEMAPVEHPAPKMPLMKNGAKANRYLKIKMPAGARLFLEVRHGEVNLGSRTKDLKANLTHSKLSGNVIEGEGTDVKASYTPLNITQWNYGVLNTSYVQNCVINKAKSIKLVSNSSNVSIGEIVETGILSGTFGELKIDKVSPGFKNLDITLKNSDLSLNLPQAPLSFNYNGTKSNIEYPKAATVKITKSYDNITLNGFYGAAGSGKIISINAGFSDVVIK